MTYDLRSEWGDRLRRIRKTQGLSGDQVAVAAGISRAMYYRMEAGQVAPSDDKRMSVATALSVRVEDIWTYPDTRAAS